MMMIRRRTNAEVMKLDTDRKSRVIKRSGSSFSNLSKPIVFCKIKKTRTNNLFVTALDNPLTPNTNQINTSITYNTKIKKINPSTNTSKTDTHKILKTLPLKHVGKRKTISFTYHSIH